MEGKGGKCRPRPPAEQLQLHNLFFGGAGAGNNYNFTCFFWGGAGAGNDYNFKVGHGGEYYVD